MGGSIVVSSVVYLLLFGWYTLYYDFFVSYFGYAQCSVHCDVFGCCGVICFWVWVGF